MTVSPINREIEFASLPENINIVESLVLKLKNEISLSDELEANVLVSLSEAVNNAILHGNKSDASKKVHGTISREDNSLAFYVEDEGNGFNPNEVIDPTAPENVDKPAGRGIYLMRHLADKVDFLKGGKKVRLLFFLN